MEALIGGATALAVGAMLFPADPALHAGRAGQAVFAALGQALQRVAAGLERRDPDETRAALDDARAIDPLLAEARELLSVRDRLAPKAARHQLARRRALAAAARAAHLDGARPELVGQVRSTAADLVRAAELVAEPGDAADRPTEELLAA